MISEGSCDSEDWSNDAEHSDLITEIKYILTFIVKKKKKKKKKTLSRKENSYFKLQKYFIMFLFLLYFWSNVTQDHNTNHKGQFF